MKRWFGLFVVIALAACGGPAAPPAVNVAPTQTRSAEMTQVAAVLAPVASQASPTTAPPAPLTPTSAPQAPIAVPPTPTGYSAAGTADALRPTATPVPPTATPAPPSRERVAVVRVTDGDTIRVRFADGREEPVRYIGIDTPETVDPRTTVECFGREASAKNAEYLAGGVVELEKDVSDRDRYDRLLRYVWVTGGDGVLRLINEELVKFGFAASSSYPPDVKYQAIFNEAQRQAQAQRLGLWGSCNSAHDPLPVAVPPTPTPRPVPPTATPVPRAAPTPTPVPRAPAPVAPAPQGNCSPAYPTICLPPPPPDLNCGDIPNKRFPVRAPDPHRLDGDGDGIGCES